MMKTCGYLAACAVVLITSGTAATITQPGNQIYGVGISGGNPSPSTVTPATGIGGTNSSPSTEQAPNAIDNNVLTKYLNFAAGSASGMAAGNYPGLIVTPSMGATVLDGFRFTTANDAPERDPLTILIYGTNTPIPFGLTGGSTITAAWTLLYNGVTGLATDPGRNTAGPFQAFTPLAPGGFTSYEVLTTSVRNSATANSMQYAELALDGTAAPVSGVPEPVAVSLLSLGIAAVIARRRFFNKEALGDFKSGRCATRTTFSASVRVRLPGGRTVRTRGNESPQRAGCRLRSSRLH